MENNPYQAPESDLEISSAFKRSVWWKIYFFFITTLSAFGFVYLFSDPRAGIIEYISLILLFVTTTGFFGFVFSKPILKPRFWLNTLVVSISFNVIYYFITNIDLRMGMSDSEFYINNFIGWFVSLPQYYALYAFSKPESPVWQHT